MRRRLIVIGSGLAGTVLANDMANDFDVLLLEKGPSKGHVTPQVTYTARHLASVPTFCYGSGGTTNLWHNGLIPLRSSDITDTGFAQVVADAEPFADAAAAALHFKGPAFSEHHARLVEEAETTGQPLGMAVDGGDCLVYPSRYSPLKPHRSVHAIYGCEITGFVERGGSVTSVRYRVNDYDQIADADVVVLAAGAMGSPGLVHMLRPDREDVGTGLIDHPMGFLGKVKFKRDYRARARNLSLGQKEGFGYRSPFRVRSNCGRFTGCVFLRPAAGMSNRLSVHKYKSRLGASQGIQRFRNAIDARILHPDVLAEIAAHLSGREIKGSTYALLFIGEQKRGNHRVKCDAGQLVVDWSVSSEELEIFRSMIKTAVERMEPALDDARVASPIDNDWLWSCAHHSGTVSMGYDGLVDANLRLRDCKNVYVCDASVIQEHSYANTGLMIAQLALRLSAHLKATQG